MDIKARIALVKMAIKILEDEPDDPRQPEALEKYKGQLAELEKRLEEEAGKPPPIVVGLKPGRLFGKAGKLNG